MKCFVTYALLGPEEGHSPQRVIGWQMSTHLMPRGVLGGIACPPNPSAQGGGNTNHCGLFPFPFFLFSFPLCSFFSSLFSLYFLCNVVLKFKSKSLPNVNCMLSFLFCVSELSFCLAPMTLVVAGAPEETLNQSPSQPWAFGMVLFTIGKCFNIVQHCFKFHNNLNYMGWVKKIYILIIFIKST